MYVVMLWKIWYYMKALYTDICRKKDGDLFILKVSMNNYWIQVRYRNNQQRIDNVTLI